jgi:K+-transporting ATPase ATPase C chain
MIVCGTILFGVIYPFCVWGVAHLFFPKKAEGSLLFVQGRNIGSEHIGQHFSHPAYFWFRPEVGCSSISGGSNLSWSSKKLPEKVEKRLIKLQKNNALESEVPCDLLMESASGFDPEISLQGALFQVKRVALSRHISENELELMVQASLEPCFFGLFPSRVNVLRLNLELDKKFPL